MCVGIPARVLRVEGNEGIGNSGGEHEAASTGPRAPGREHRAASTGLQARDREHGAARAGEHSGARIGALRAQCETRHGPCTIDLALTGALAPGTWVLTFLGAAREVIDAARARDIDAALDALEAIARGETRLDAYFPDLIDREPALPAHLAHLAAPLAASVIPVAPVTPAVSAPVISAPVVSAPVISAKSAMADPAHSPGKSGKTTS